MPTPHDIFISYGRKDSKDFAIKLHDRLVQEKFKVWLDSDMPPAVEFQTEINQAIEISHHFIFIIAPHAVKSKFCRPEIDLAVQLNKRIIPIMYLPPKDCWDKMPPVLNQLDQLFFRKDKLEKGEIDFEEKFADLVSALRRDAEVIKQHTRFLIAALYWEKNRSTENLLIADERKQAEVWLKDRAKEKYPLCVPTDLQCEYICESTRNADNLMTQVFISYAIEDKAFMQKLCQFLLRHHVTLKVSVRQTILNFDSRKDINLSIDEADNFLFLLSPASVQSEVCQQQLAYAKNVNKRVFALLIADMDKGEQTDKGEQMDKGEHTGSPLQIIKKLQIIDFKGYSDSEENRSSEYQLLYELNNDADYYEQHKVLLVKALKWHRRKFNDTLLLRGANLDYFDTWFSAAQKRQNHPPIDKQIEFIEKSRRQAQYKPSETLDVFIAYSRTDSDFARQLNEHLQYDGNKTTWFDQESIPATADFEQEMLNGITKSHHFLFIISPQSVNSPFCEKEVEHAQALNKRIVTLLYRQPDPFKLHKALKPIHWIDFSKSAHFNRSKADEVIRVLKTDEAYFSQQTKWLLRAQAWLNKKKDEGSLLQGSEFEEAKTWLEEAKTKVPYVHANSLQQQLIQASEYEIKTKVLSDRLSKALTKNFWMLWTCGALCVIVLGMSLYVWQQKNAQTDCEQAPTQVKLEEINTKQWEIFRDSLQDGSKGPEMVLIPVGEFQMGDIQGDGEDDEKPVHQVSVSVFAMGRYEVTVKEFRQFVKATKYVTDAEKGGGCYVKKAGSWGYVADANWRNPYFSQEDNQPVTCVSWNDATAYTEWLSKETGQIYRLPTEAEWEYAARAGTETKYWWGNEIGSNEANCRKSVCGDSFEYTAPVGSFAANSFELYDMAGNVWEWTCSEYENSYNSKEKSCSSSKEGLFVLRGGSWGSIAGGTRSAVRSKNSQAGRVTSYGFRPVRLL